MKKNVALEPMPSLQTVKLKSSKENSSSIGASMLNNSNPTPLNAVSTIRFVSESSFLLTNNCEASTSDLLF
ncbi:hypothetical protein T10_993 [Trichinella papuae]|nr:hypothetical protein T10_993 [Trichinella papuae]